MLHKKYFDRYLRTRCFCIRNVTLIRQQLVRVKNRIRAQFPRSILCIYMLQIKIKFRLKFFNPGLFSISLMWYGCILYTSHIKLCTVAMFKIHKIDRSARLYLISGHLVLLWLSTGSCWNSKADGHWQKQTMNLPRSGTDRSGYVHQWSPMSCGQPRHPYTWTVATLAILWIPSCFASVR